MSWSGLIDFLTNLDWELILAAFSVFAGTGIAYWKMDKITPKFRSKLKTDLEILSLITDKHSDNYYKIKNSIDKEIDEIYSKDKRYKKQVDGYGILGWYLIFLLFFIIIEILLIKFQLTWWLVVPGFFLFISFVAIFSKFLEPIVPPIVDEYKSRIDGFIFDNGFKICQGLKVGLTDKNNNFHSHIAITDETGHFEINNDLNSIIKIRESLKNEDVFLSIFDKASNLVFQKPQKNGLMFGEKLSLEIVLPIKQAEPIPISTPSTVAIPEAIPTG